MVLLCLYIILGESEVALINTDLDDNYLEIFEKENLSKKKTVHEDNKANVYGMRIMKTLNLSEFDTADNIYPYSGGNNKR